MKNARLFRGCDSFGRHLEEAIDENGNGFVRFYGYNGYGMTWSKWKPAQVTLSNKYVNVYSGEESFGDEYAEYGFSKLHEVKNARIRLPQIATA